MKPNLTTSLALAGLLLAGCSADFLTQPKINADIYTLTDVPAPATAAVPSVSNLIIEKVEVSAGIKTDKIAYVENNQINYYDKTKWADDLDEVIESAVTESFENAGLFKSVSIENNNVNSDYGVSLYVRDFQIENGKAKVKISTKLLTLPQREVALNFVSESEVDSNSVSSLNDAFANVQKDIIQKVADYISKSPVVSSQ